MFKKIFKIISVIFIVLITCAVFYVGYNGKTSIEIPKDKPNFDLSSKIHLSHFQNNNLSVEKFKQSMVTDSPKIYVFWTGWCSFSRDFLNSLGETYQKYPNIKFVFINLDKESNLTNSNNLHKYYDIRNESNRIDTDNKFMDFSNHRSIEKFMKQINSDFEKHPGLPYFIGIEKKGKIICEVAGFDKVKTYAEFDKYLSDFK
jgi:thiol-disulfide isomerase/thioredoxin